MALRKRPLAAGIASLFFSGYLAALGLGEIRLNSALNEPLDAEIPLLNMGELTESDIIAGLASNADFSAAGVDRELILTTLVFDLDMEAPGGPILRVMSKKPIREPYLDFLVDVQWPSGRLLREYTLLLDLPVFAGGAAKKKIEQPAARQSGAPQRSGTPRPATGRPGGERPRPEVVAGDREYLVERGETLWSIARRLDTDASIHERMEAILQINPDAFIDGDINLLKRGAVLRLPDYGAMDSQLAGRGAYTADEPGYSPELSGSSRQERPSAPVSNGGRLTLEAGNETGGERSSVGTGAGTMSGVRGELTGMQEELDRSRRENSDLKQRLSSLEDQIVTMQRLLEIGDDDLRAIQLSERQQAIDEQALDPAAGEAGEPGADEGMAMAPGGDEAAELDDLEVDSPALALFPSANVSRKRPVSLVDDPQAGEVRLPTAGDPVGEGDDDGRNGGGLETGAGAVAPMEAESGLETEPQDDVAEGSQGAKSAATPTKMDLETKNEGWFDQVNGFLAALLAIVVIIIGAVAFLMWRRRQEDEEEYQPPAEAYTPPPVAPVRERPREKPPEPPARSMDDIELREEDDLFAQPEEVPVAAPPAPVATAPVPPPQQEEPQSLEDMELDLSEFDLDEAEEPREELVFEESEREPAAADELNLDEEFDFLGDIDEGDTQLELAQAYIEMGDQPGAKEILQEVAEGGSDEQKTKARELLEQMA